jgi:hypothetical protein
VHRRVRRVEGATPSRSGQRGRWPLKGCHLTSSPFLLGLDDRHDALNVERAHPMSVAPPPARRNGTTHNPTTTAGLAADRTEIAGRRGRSIAQALGVMRYFSPVACLA